MAASSSSNPLLPSITIEEFKSFHTIDRRLFARLVLNLDRDPPESVQVIAFWQYLEHAGHTSRLIEQLLSYSDSILNALADEAILCLTCIEKKNMLDFEIPLTVTVNKNSVSPTYFHENRVNVIRGVTRNVNEVCVKAFDDIVLLAIQARAERDHSLDEYFDAMLNDIMSSDHNHHTATGVGGTGNRVYGGAYHFQRHNNMSNFINNNNIYNENEIIQGLRQINLSNGQDEVGAEDRTIFLTFSKGYPISEDEVRAFFTGMLGECLEAIYMQEVEPPHEQPLYARLVLRNRDLLQALLEGNKRAKFSINGKHVWARKYTRKNPKSANSPSPSQPSSPGAS